MTNVISGVDPRVVARALRSMKSWRQAEEAKEAVARMALAVYEPMTTEEIRRDDRSRLLGPKPSDSRYEDWRKELRRRLYGPRPSGWIHGGRPREDTVRRRRCSLSAPPLRGWDDARRLPKRAARFIGGRTGGRMDRWERDMDGCPSPVSRRNGFYNATAVRLPREEWPTLIAVYASYEGKGRAGQLEVARCGWNIFGELRVRG